MSAGRRPDHGRRQIEMEASKCPKCGEEPHFLEHIEKWYCYGCNSYIDDGVEHVCEAEEKKEECAEAIKKELKALEEEPKLECRNCGAQLEGIKDGKLFCLVCETYEDGTPVGPKEAPKDANDSQKLLDSVLAEPAPKPASPEPVKEEPKAEPPPAIEEPVVVATEPVPEAAREEIPEVRMCPTCEQATKWIEKYQRHYCYSCRKYVVKEAQAKPPEAAPAPKSAKTCPGCGGELKFIDKYSEYYCFACKKYPLREARRAEAKKAPEPAAEPPKKASALACPKCKGSLRWIEKYSRHYCDGCKEYAPKGYGGSAAGQGDKKVCPLCKGQMKFIAEYNEWYCYKCKKYSLRPGKPVLLI